MKRYNKVIAFITLCLAALLLIQLLFYIFQDINSKKTNTIIFSLLKDEKISSNPYTVSQMLQSVESSGLIKCAKLRKSHDPVFYYSSISWKGCSSSFWTLAGKKVNAKFKSVSGVEWELEYVSLNSVLFSSFLNISRLASLVIIMLVLWFIFAREKIKDMKLQLLNKESIVLHQVLHDIRSPVFVLSELLSAGFDDKNRDEMLKHAIGRIQSTIDEINLKSRNKSNKSINFDLGEMIKSIVTEKKIQFKNNAQIILENKINGNVFVDLNKSDLERVLSNLINNAVEAAGEKPMAKITLQAESDVLQIIVLDGGLGFPDEVKDKIGQVRISKGKDDLKDSGSGLGLLHAFEKVNEMGGSISIQSSVSGSSVILSFKKFEIRKINNEMIDYLYVEDDAMMCYMWEQAAKQCNFNVKIINHPMQIEECLHLMNKENTKIYSDSSFEGAKGEDLLVELHRLGFKNLYLTTGYSEDKFKDEKRFSVLGKMIPF